MKRIAFYLTIPLLYVLSLFPFWILHLISNLFGFLLHTVIGYRKKMILNYLERIFPDKSKQERRQITKDFYYHLSDVIVETLKSITLSPTTFQKRFKVVNIEALTQFEKQNRSVFIVCGHYSNWEWMASLGLQFETLHPYLIYSPLKNPYFNNFIKRIRKKYRVLLLPRQQTLKTIQTQEKKGIPGVYGFAMDQSPTTKSKSYWRSFLGIRVPVFTGAERMAREHNIPLVFASINRLKRGYYEVSFEVLEENPSATLKNQITDCFYDKLEAQIYKDPAQYLWSHKRFKHEGKETTSNSISLP